MLQTWKKGQLRLPFFAFIYLTFLDNTMNDCLVSEGCSVCNVVLVSGHFKQFVQLMTKEIDGLFRILGP